MAGRAALRRPRISGSPRTAMASLIRLPVGSGRAIFPDLGGRRRRDWPRLWRLPRFPGGGQAGQVAVTAAVSSLYPIIPLAAGLVVFHERLRWRQVLGVGCIVAGLVMIGLGKDAMGTMLARGEEVMRAPLVSVSVILSLAGTVPIVVQVLRGKARPQPLSWGLRARADPGDEHAAFQLAGLLKARGDLDGAEQILRAWADDGDEQAADRLAKLLAGRGDLDGAEQILRARADDGDEQAAFQLARPGPG